MSDDQIIRAAAERQRRWEEQRDQRDLAYFAALAAIVAFGFRVFGVKRISTFEVIFTAFGVLLGAALLAFTVAMGLHFARQREDARWLVCGFFFMGAACVFIAMGGGPMIRFAMSMLP